MKKKIVILGSGESGTGAAILAKLQGYDVFVTDMNSMPGNFRNELIHYQIEFEEGGHNETRVLTADELITYEEISDEPIDLSETLNDMAGLLLRDRLMVLGIAEICLWNDRIITQDELDVLELLYWRLGFKTEEIVEQMQKQNSLMIV